MANKQRSKIRSGINLTATVLVFSVLGWVYFMGIVCPDFASPFREIYRGLGSGMLYVIYFQLIPAYMQKFFPSIRPAAVLVPLISAVITVILLFTAFPQQGG
jgi:hypothetical protein